MAQREGSGHKGDRVGSSALLMELAGSPRVRRVVGQFARFCTVGAIGAVVDFGLLILLLDGFGWDVEVELVGRRFLVANMISVLVAMVPVFLLNKHWTLAERGRRDTGRQGASFFALYATTWVLNQVLTAVFTYDIPIMQELFGRRTVLVAKVLAVGVIVVVNFLGLKLWVFRRRG